MSVRQEKLTDRLATPRLLLGRTVLSLGAAPGEAEKGLELPRDSAEAAPGSPTCHCPLGWVWIWCTVESLVGQGQIELLPCVGGDD